MTTINADTDMVSPRSVETSGSNESKSKPRWLAASPYSEPDHLLDLDTLDTQNRLFAVALSTLKLATDEYATVKYEDVFDFSGLMAQLKALADQAGVQWKSQEFYVVEFRSQLKAEYDRERLSYLDKESHREAVASGYLLKYWFGVPNAERRNLATCFWRNKTDAIKGGQGPQHHKARGIIMKTYESINVKGLSLTIEDDVAEWKIQPHIVVQSDAARGKL